MRVVLIGLVFLATELGLVCGASNPPRSLRAGDESEGQTTKTSYEPFFEGDPILSSNGTGIVTRESEVQARRSLSDHFLAGEVFYPVKIFDAKEGRCLAGGSKRKDTVGRKRLVKMKDCKTQVKNKARWSVFKIPNGEFKNKIIIFSVLLWGDGTDNSKQLCLVARKLKNRGRLEMADCATADDSLLWESSPSGNNNQDLLRIPTLDDPPVDLCVNYRARLVPCDNDDGITNEEKGVTEFLTVVRTEGEP